MERKIHAFASYIKSKRNKIAEFESTKISENLEWQNRTIYPQIYNKSFFTAHLLMIYLHQE